MDLIGYRPLGRIGRRSEAHRRVGTEVGLRIEDILQLRSLHFLAISGCRSRLKNPQSAIRIRNLYALTS